MEIVKSLAPFYDLTKTCLSIIACTLPLRMDFRLIVYKMHSWDMVDQHSLLFKVASASLVPFLPRRGRNPKTFMAITIVSCTNYCPRRPFIDLRAMLAISCTAIPLHGPAAMINKLMVSVLEVPRSSLDSF